MHRWTWSILVVAAIAAGVTNAVAAEHESFPGGTEPVYRSGHVTVGTGAGWSTYGDTTYVGYSPGQASAANPWSIRASRTTSGTSDVHRPPAAGCMWNWDAAGEPGPNGYINGDSLQGWWPVRLSWRYLLDPAQPDYNLPGAAADFGNLTNYAPVDGRTFGIVGAWHRDPGGNAAGSGAANGVTWVPLQGQYSAWCGLRVHADPTAPVDAVTGNAFTADVAMFNVHDRYTSANAVPKFPGYVDQWDQMLYRDIDMTSNLAGNLTLAFRYSTRMSTAPDIAGWFDKDPLTVTSDGVVNCAPDNFISNWDVAGAGPADSFMVYVGQPVESTFQPYNGQCSSPSGRLPIYDPLRRWFDEVVEANDPGKVIELLSAAGNDSNHVVSVTIPNSRLAPILAANGGLLRLVFRVKTNAQYSDVSGPGYDSHGRGAALIDGVTYTISGGGSSPAGWGDFESASAIDNTQGALAAWRSTGKPPAVMTHVEALGRPGVAYDDLCGDPSAVGRACSMSGGVVTFGWHDGGETIGNPQPYTADHEAANGILSPSIPLRSNNGAWPNAIGIAAPGNAGDAIAGQDIAVDYEVFAKSATATMPPAATGIVYRWLAQCYPQLTGGSAAGRPQWGEITRSYANAQSDPVCFRSLAGQSQEGSLQALGMLRWSSAASENASYPDSIRIGWMEESTCFTDGVNACNPAGGLYIDDVSLVILDGHAFPMSAEIWNFWQTAFPWNEAVTPAFSVSFDTTAVLVKSGLDIGPRDGLNSFDVPGDSIVVTASGVAPMRVDLVFRILPGPGNYRICGNAGSGLTPNPSAGNPANASGRPAVVANVASANFWESFLANNGPFGTPGGHPGGVWSPNVWNSARCDTAEINLFPRGVDAPTARVWMSTYIEGELGVGPNDAYSGSTVVRSGLGRLRHKCFLSSDAAPPYDVDCAHDPPASGTGYDLSWVTRPGSGYDGNPMTKEGTKIIPDGLLTPGAHVEYFWRRADGGVTTMTGMMPDTSIVVPQLGERSKDGHRWAAFGVLPDRWKQVGYSHPLGLTTGNPACMLVVNDQASNGGEWPVWRGVADTIGATSNQKWGAESGWHAKSNGADVNLPVNNYDRAGRAGFIAEHGGNAGTTWDAYTIIAAENLRPAGSFGARYAHSDASNTQINDRRQQGAPTLEQLKAFYKIVLWVSGNLDASIVGPAADRGSDDQQLIKDYLVSGNPSTLNRVFYANGSGFVEANEREGQPTMQTDLDANYLGVSLQDPSYRAASGNTSTRVGVLGAAGGPLAFESLSANNLCSRTDDVLGIAVGAVQPWTQVLMNYTDPDTSDATTYPATILKSHTFVKPWAAITEGYELSGLTSNDVSKPCTAIGHYINTFSQVLGGVCPVVGLGFCSGHFNACGQCIDVPLSFAVPDYVALANNPSITGMPRIRFGLAHDSRVEVQVYDVGGRLVRTLANRAFAAGEHLLVWDGADDAGRRVAHGVYFTQIRYRDTGFVVAKKITILK